MKEIKKLKAIQDTNVNCQMKWKKLKKWRRIESYEIQRQ